jgi:hypothetical protein
MFLSSSLNNILEKKTKQAFWLGQLIKHQPSYILNNGFHALFIYHNKHLLLLLVFDNASEHYLH